MNAKANSARDRILSVIEAIAKEAIEPHVNAQLVGMKADAVLRLAQAYSHMFASGAAE